MSGYYGIDQSTTLRDEPLIGDMMIILKSDHMKRYNKAAMNAYMYLSIKGQHQMAEEVAQIILEACR